MRRLAWILAICLLIPAVGFAWTVYDLSVRYGSADPCEMIANKITDDFFDTADPAGIERRGILGAAWRNQEDAHHERQISDLREQGALACWRSVLFGTKTGPEIVHDRWEEAHTIKAFWEHWETTGDENFRHAAVMNFRHAHPDVRNLNDWPEELVAEAQRH